MEDIKDISNKLEKHVDILENSGIIVFKKIKNIERYVNMKLDEMKNILRLSDSKKWISKFTKVMATLEDVEKIMEKLEDVEFGLYYQKEYPFEELNLCNDELD